MTFYAELLEGLLFWVKLLNEAEKMVEELPDQTPYLGPIPVILGDQRIGTLYDEIGGVWCFRAEGASDGDG